MDATSYMILGFAVAFLVIFLHLGSFLVRYRNLARDISLLEELNKKPAKKKALANKRSK